MTHFRKFVTAAWVLLLVVGAVPSLRAQGVDESNWPMTMTFSRPFQIENHVFSPGSYFFQLSPGTWARNVVMVYNLDKGYWEGMFLGINVDRSDAHISHGFRTDGRCVSGFTFADRGASNPETLEYWFYPGWERGVKFTYPPTRTAKNNIGSVTVADVGPRHVR